MQSSTETATKHNTNSTADSNTHHLQNVGEDRLLSSADEDGDFVPMNELMKNFHGYMARLDDAASTSSSIGSHQGKVPYLQVIIDGQSYIDFDDSRNILVSQEGGEKESTTRSMGSHVSNSVKFDNNRNVLNFEKGDEDVNADAFTVWQQSQEESREKSDDEASESPHAEWSIYLQQKKETEGLAQKPFASLLNDLQAEATPLSQQSFPSVSYLTPAPTTINSRKLKKK